MNDPRIFLALALARANCEKVYLERSEYPPASVPISPTHYRRGRFIVEPRRVSLTQFAPMYEIPVRPMRYESPKGILPSPTRFPHDENLIYSRPHPIAPPSENIVPSIETDNAQSLWPAQERLMTGQQQQDPKEIKYASGTKPNLGSKRRSWPFHLESDPLHLSAKRPREDRVPDFAYVPGGPLEAQDYSVASLWKSQRGSSHANPIHVPSSPHRTGLDTEVQHQNAHDSHSGHVDRRAGDDVDDFRAHLVESTPQTYSRDSLRSTRQQKEVDYEMPAFLSERNRYMNGPTMNSSTK